MPVLPLVLLLLAQAGAENPKTAAPATTGYLPSGTPSELRDLGLLARLRDPGVRSFSFSSYDRTGGNNDGFKGTYSKMRVEDGNSVLAEASGPGIIQRIWFTHTSGEQPGLLDHKHEHLKIYIDGVDRPALDIPLETLFSGTHPCFPRPLVSEGSGGFVSYVPIPFRSGCKVVVEGQGVRFYQINLVALPAESTLRSFTATPEPEHLAELARAARTWARSGEDDYEKTDLAGADFARYEIEGLSNSAHLYTLRAGPATVRSLEILPAPGTEDAWRAARLRMVWDHDEAGDAGVDLPLGLAFGVVDAERPYQSLLLGQKAGRWFSRFPMPYHRQAIVRIDTPKPLKGTMVVRTTRGVAPDAGYFHAALREAVPTRPKEDFTWLQETGRGHFAGVLLMTEGKAKLPFWLEGDDRFTIDSRLAIHGTGSEDYFNCGWYALEGRLDRPAAYPLHGFPIYRGHEGTWQATAYRWHLSDPVTFSRSINAGIEHGGENDTPANYRAAVFWYSERPDSWRTGR